MRLSLERLRWSLLALAILLVIGLAAVLGYARWRVRRAVRDLPAKLGISIERSTNGFDVSKSEGGRTLFTLHAAKMIQYKGRGTAALQDVSITLFDPDGAPADRIYGENFAYDPVQSTVRAQGAVQIDLWRTTGPQSAAKRAEDKAGVRTGEGKTSGGAAAEHGAVGSGSSAGLSGAAAGSGNVVHVKTADLVFDQKTGSASTSRLIQFRVGNVSGSADGASFDAHAGVCILQSKVVLDASLKSGPLAVRASHALFDRGDRRLDLLAGDAEYDSSHTWSDHATVFFRPDGAADHIDLHGHVKTSKGGGMVTAPNERVSFGEKSQPRQALLSGGLVFSDKDPARSLHGTAGSAIVSFAARSMLRHVQLMDAVSVVDEQISQKSTRNLTASKLDIDLAEGKGRPVVSRALAQGEAVLHLFSPSAGGRQDAQIRADRLLATLPDGRALSDVRGSGHTMLSMTAPNGIVQTSTGDRIHMEFAGASGASAGQGRAESPAARSTLAPKLGSMQAAALQSAEQEGNVVFVQQAPPAETGSSRKPAADNIGFGSGPLRATAHRVVFTAATNLIALYGAEGNSGGAEEPRVEQAGGFLTARTIEFNRETGDASAAGNVQVTYDNSSALGPARGPARAPRTSGTIGGISGAGAAPEPLHVIAARARLERARGRASFYGVPGRDARLWQGADSISAPALEISSVPRTLSAHGLSGAASRPVHLVLTGASAPGAALPPGKEARTADSGQPTVVRVSSGSLLYSDRDGKAQLRGGVLMQDPSGSVHSQEMDLSLGPPPGKALGSSAGKTPQGAAGAAGKQVQRIVARGQVLLEQPGRRATGSLLVYTAANETFVLTGTSAAPPRLTDQRHGAMTGTSLIFNDRDDSVVVSGGPSTAVTEMKK